MDFRPSNPLSVGMELELQLLNRDSLDLRDGILPLLELLPDNPYVKPEYIQNTVEIASRVCHDLDELEAHVKAVACEISTQCESLNMVLCAAGTHPFGRQLALITPFPRYLRMEKEEGYVSHIQITFATHVHLGMTSGDEAITMMRELKPYLPLLIALSASSPFWRGYDTQYASYRHRILAATRSYGIPPSFETWQDFCRFLSMAQGADVFRSINDIHWDLRPRPHFGTLEVRVMDAQPTVARAVALAGLIRALVMYLRRTPAKERPARLPRPLHWWLEKHNHFQASHRGLAAKYIGDDEGTVIALRDVFQRVVETIAPAAEDLGQSAHLARLAEHVNTGLSYERQRREYAATGSPKQVTASLVEELSRELCAPHTTPAARPDTKR